jgi:phosphopantothenoylcysteine decarboxylase / phosphopantothenate---cysteine ligase
MHPTDALRGAKSKALEGKRIVLAITGSIAAVECFDLSRELIRHGAQVHAVLSEAAAKLVTPWSMEFATGNPVIEVIDGMVQHVSLLGDVEGKADLLLISPSTANTISKIACGIDDTPVTTMATVAIGSGTPVMIAPAMHLAMYNNPFVRKNLETLASAGVELIGPRIEGKKAKVAENDEIVARVIRRIGKSDLRGKKVLIIGGSSEEPIDEMRVITNRGTGTTGVQLALAAFYRGAEVELWMGRCQVPIPSYLDVKRFASVEDLLALERKVTRKDVVIVPAALGDYAPITAKGKIPSGKNELDLVLRPLPKVLDALRPKANILVGFKAEYGLEEKQLIARAKKRLDAVPLELVVANDLKSVCQESTKALIIKPKGKTAKFEGSKAMLADRVLDEVLHPKG